MTPCPLCLLGFAQPHSREDWKRLASEEALQKKLDEILDARARELGDAPPDICG